jgi:ferredoxin
VNPDHSLKSAPPAIIHRGDLQTLIHVLRERGYQVIGPQIQGEAIVYDEITSVDMLPAGWMDEQNGGTYRLKRRDDKALFAHTVGPHSWKRFLHPPRRRLWSADRSNGSIEIHAESEETPRFAFLGVRACELRAIEVQDRVLMSGEHPDPVYKARREAALIIAVNCARAGGTCFCVSMDSGPKVKAGFDLALTELIGEGEHRFLVESGSARGRDVLSQTTHRAAQADEIERAAAISKATAESMGRVMDTAGIRDLLVNHPEHPRWEEVATRCLSCANCTMVCPTCFCSTVEDTSDLTGDHTERWQRWDSCFNLDFSHMAGGSARSSVRSRYRQWMTHKLATWFDQFDSSGCVGCGRCITWCPVGIDITEEVAAIRADSGKAWQTEETRSPSDVEDS